MTEDSLTSRQPASRTETTLPFVSIVMPVYNEENYIGRILKAIIEQDYPAGQFEIIVADGESTDRTREIVEIIQATHPEVRMVSNPERIVSAGLNRAIACARGDVIVRLDGHCEYPNDYVRTIVSLRQKLGADNIGGVLEPVGTGYVQCSVAAAYKSPVGVGGPALKASASSTEVKEVDAVHAGCWLRERLLKIGGFDESMVRNQDDELSFRLRKNGGHIYQFPSLRVRYHVRSKYSQLFMQFAQYGFWKVRVVRKHPQQASLRHFVPAIFITALLGFMLLAPAFSWALIAATALLTLHVGGLALVSAATLGSEIHLLPGVVMALLAMHWGYGIGFVFGCLRTWFGAGHGARIFERVTR